MSVIPKIPRASGGPKPPWAPYQGSTLDQLGTLSGPQTPRLLTPPLTTNPGSAPDNWPPRNNWNIVESGLKHHNPNPNWTYVIVVGVTISRTNLLLGNHILTWLVGRLHLKCFSCGSNIKITLYQKSLALCPSLVKIGSG